MAQIIEADIAVIGAGIAGASVSSLLARNKKVVLIEKESFAGMHSSGRSAATFASTYGNATVQQLSRASAEFFHSPPAGFCETKLVSPRGALIIADESQAAALESFMHAESSADRSERLTGAAIRKLCPIIREDLITQAVYLPDVYDIEVNTLLQAFLKQFKKSGGIVMCDSELQAISKDRDVWRLQLRDAEIKAPVIVNAAGAWADEIGIMAGCDPIGLCPKRRTAVLVDPPEDYDIAAWPLVVDADETYYFKPDAGKLLLSPADETPSPPCDVQPELIDVAYAVDKVQKATTLDVKKVSHSWAGLRNFVEDKSPVVGFDGKVENFFWFSGQGGYGIQISPALSRLADALILSRDIPDDILREGFDPASVSPERETISRTQDHSEPAKSRMA